jgi:hypothetical protein
MMEEKSITPAAQRVDGWTPAKQRLFLQLLSECGTVEMAADLCGMSRQTAYRLRTQKAGLAFKLGWDAAILLARAHLSDVLMARALTGWQEEAIRDSDGLRIVRHRVDNRVGMAMLKRLDEMATQTEQGTASALVQTIAQDFEAYLDMIDTGGTGAGAALFVAARQDASPWSLAVLAGIVPEAAPHCNLVQEVAPPVQQDPIEDFVRDCSVWRDDSGDLQTDFPPPPDFESFEETHSFGDDMYKRNLTAEEEAAYLRRVVESMAPLKAAAETARNAYFGFVPKRIRPKKQRKARPKRPEQRASVPALHLAPAIDPSPLPAPEPVQPEDAGARRVARKEFTSCGVRIYEPGTDTFTDEFMHTEEHGQLTGVRKIRCTPTFRAPWEPPNFPGSY